MRQRGQAFQLFIPYCFWAHSCPLHLGLAPMFPSLTDVGLVKCCWPCPIIGSPGGSVLKNLPVRACQCRRHGFDPCVGKTPCRRAWQPTPVFLPGESHGQRSLVGYSPWGRKKSRIGLSDSTTTNCPILVTPQCKRPGITCPLARTDLREGSRPLLKGFKSPPIKSFPRNPPQKSPLGVGPRVLLLLHISAGLSLPLGSASLSPVEADSIRSSLLHHSNLPLFVLFKMSVPLTHQIVGSRRPRFRD